MSPWKFLNNTFLTVTEESNRACKKLGDYTLSALNQSAQSGAEPFVTLANELQLYVTDFNNQYANWKSTQGTQKSKTNTLVQNLATLSSQKIDDWEFATQQQYRKNTPEFIDIFPNGRSPFQSGSQEDRLAAVSTLSKKLNDYDSLEALRIDVNSFLASLTASFNSQKSTKAGTKMESGALEAARVKVCEELFGTYGALIQFYRKTPLEVGNYFDLQTLRNREQTTFTHNIDGGELRLALTHTFDDDEEVRILNQGNTQLRFALCAEANDPIGERYLDVPPNDERVVLALELGSLENRYLKVQNLNDTEGGRYTITLL